MNIARGFFSLMIGVFMAGILLEEKLVVPLFVLAGAVLGLISLFCFFQGGQESRAAFWLLLSFLCGAWYLAWYQIRIFPQILDEAFAQEHPVWVEGKISSEIRPAGEAKNGPRASFMLDVARLKISNHWENCPGRLWVRVYKNVPLRYGETLVAEGRLLRPPEFRNSRGFSYRQYLRHAGVRYVFSVKKAAALRAVREPRGVVATVMAFRARCGDGFTQYLSPAEARLMQMFFLDERVPIAVAVRDAFVRTGTAHILAISGSHVAIVVLLLLTVVKIFPIGRRGQYVFTIVAIGFYAILAGGSAPVVRAALTASIFLLALIFERESDGLNSLGLAALIILAGNPFAVFAVDFQLSFVSVLFILLFYPRIYEFLARSLTIKNRDGLVAYLTALLAVTLTAWAGTLGLVIYYFGIFTPIALLANLILVPISTCIIALGFVLLAVSFWFSWGASAVAACLKVVINLFVYLAFLLAKIPGGWFLVTDITFWQICVYYICLASLAFAAVRKIAIKGWCWVLFGRPNP